MGCSGREKFREEAHHLPGWTQSPLVQEKWEEEETGKSTGLESGVWSQGGGSGSWFSVTRSLCPQGQLITPLGKQTGGPHRREVKPGKG